MKRKIIIVVVGFVLLLGLGSTAAQAGVHHASRKAAVCNVSGCRNTKLHKHKNITYAGHHARDGHRHSGGGFRRHH